MTVGKSQCRLQMAGRSQWAFVCGSVPCWLKIEPRSAVSPQVINHQCSWFIGDHPRATPSAGTCTGPPRDSSVFVGRCEEVSVLDSCERCGCHATFRYTTPAVFESPSPHLSWCATATQPLTRASYTRSWACMKTYLDERINAKQ